MNKEDQRTSVPSAEGLLAVTAKHSCVPCMGTRLAGSTHPPQYEASVFTAHPAHGFQSSQTCSLLSKGKTETPKPERTELSIQNGRGVRKQPRIHTQGGGGTPVRLSLVWGGK